MKIKVTEATKRQINWVVSKIEGITWGQGDLDAGEYGPGFKPATNAAHAWPIIERKKICLGNHKDGVQRQAVHSSPISWNTRTTAFGPDSLVAAMRCHIISELGREVEVPDELAGPD